MDRGRGTRAGRRQGGVETNPESRLGGLSEQGPAFLGLWEEGAATGLGMSGQTAIPWPEMKKMEIPNE